MKHTIVIEGMHCDGCVRRVKAILGKVEGVRVDDVAVGRAEVDFADDAGGDAVLAALKRAGYEAHEGP